MRPGDFKTLFLAFWLTFWSFGVAMLQGFLLGAGDGGLFDAVPLLFLFTHGGSEVFVQSLFSAHLRDNALQPSAVEASQDLEGRTVSWRRGSPSVIQWVATYVVPVLTLLILLVSAGLTLLGDTGALRSALDMLLAAAWIGVMGWLWLPTWRAQARSTDRVALQVHAHGVALTERTTAGRRALDFAARSLVVEGLADLGQHRLAADGQRCHLLQGHVCGHPGEHTLRVQTDAAPRARHRRSAQRLSTHTSPQGTGNTVRVLPTPSPSPQLQAAATERSEAFRATWVR